jgi:hypothetical protein
MATSPLDFLLSSVYPGALAPEHRVDLQKSGLRPETIQAQGIRSVPPAMIGQLLGFDIATIRSALLFPYPAPGGGWMPHVRMKVFPTLTDKDGHTTKYLQPRGTPPRLYFCRLVLERVLRDAEPLRIIEGEKKAAAVAQRDLAAVGIAGVEGWHVKGSRALLADFDALPLARRAVTLVPDGDIRTNPDVERAVARFARALDERGARVRIAVLPLAPQVVAG